MIHNLPPHFHGALHPFPILPKGAAFELRSVATGEVVRRGIVFHDPLTTPDFIWYHSKLRYVSGEHPVCHSYESGLECDISSLCLQPVMSFGDFFRSVPFFLRVLLGHGRGRLSTTTSASVAVNSGPPVILQELQQQQQSTVNSGPPMMMQEPELFSETPGEIPLQQIRSVRGRGRGLRTTHARFSVPVISEPPVIVQNRGTVTDVNPIYGSVLGDGTDNRTISGSATVPVNTQRSAIPQVSVSVADIPTPSGLGGSGSTALGVHEPFPASRVSGNGSPLVQSDDRSFPIVEPPTEIPAFAMKTMRKRRSDHGVPRMVYDRSSTNRHSDLNRLHHQFMR